ncbi:MAG TPA: YraN family protein [Gammaproteobacteria bacterium]|nr:YraN family protein [Gammaproteobacteria bacterium]
MANPFSRARAARLRRRPERGRGHAAEDAALAYLRRRGLVLVERNYRCPGGELDLVMREHESLVFVEVRHRRRASHGSAAESVDACKRQRLVRAAMHYLQRTGQAARTAARFDVVALSGPLERCRIEWIRNAFDA